MRIGILGTGMIGKQLSLKLCAAGHDVKIANSRGPETIQPDVLSNGAKAVTAEKAVIGTDVIIISIPLERIPGVAPLLSDIPDDVAVIDTSNYYPYRTGRFHAIDAGQVESEWVAEQLGRRIAKAWNAIYFRSFEDKSQPSGAPGRLAVAIAADDERDRKVAMALVEDTGFDAVDTGSIKDSWRLQPGAPAYCTDLTREELLPALRATERERLPKRRELFLAVMQERTNGSLLAIDADFPIRLARAIQM